MRRLVVASPWPYIDPSQRSDLEDSTSYITAAQGGSLSNHHYPLPTHGRTHVRDDVDARRAEFAQAASLYDVLEAITE